MQKTENEFFHQVAKGMAACQELEQRLKLYIHEAYGFVRECLNGKLPFTFGTVPGDVDVPLGKLIDLFQKLSADPALIAELRAFAKERNFLSHQAITHCYDYGGDYSEITAVDLHPRLEKIQKEAVRLTMEIHRVHGSLLVQYMPEVEEEIETGGTSAVDQLI